MKEIIKKVTFTKEYETKFGTLYGFKVEYGDKVSWYSAKKKDQTKFIEGKEAEFTEETRTGQKGEYTIIKPIYNQGQSNYGKALKREQARYSTMGASYVKDLIISGKVDLDDWTDLTSMIVKFMMNLDKEIES